MSMYDESDDLIKSIMSGSYTAASDNPYVESDVIFNSLSSSDEQSFTSLSTDDPYGESDAIFDSIFTASQQPEPEESGVIDTLRGVQDWVTEKTRIEGAPEIVSPQRRIARKLSAATEGVYGSFQKAGAFAAGKLGFDETEQELLAAGEASQAKSKEMAYQAMYGDDGLEQFKNMTDPQWWESTLTQMAPGSAPFMAGVATGGALGAKLYGVPGAIIGGMLTGAGTLFVQTIGDAFYDGKAEGLSEDEATNYALAKSGATAVLNAAVIPLSLAGAPAASAAAKPLSKEIVRLALRFTGAEVTTEVSDTAMENLIDQAYIDPDIKLSRGMVEAVVGGFLFDAATVASVRRSGNIRAEEEKLARDSDLMDEYISIKQQAESEVEAAGGDLLAQVTASSRALAEADLRDPNIRVKRLIDDDTGEVVFMEKQTAAQVAAEEARVAEIEAEDQEADDVIEAGKKMSIAQLEKEAEEETVKELKTLEAEAVEEKTDVARADVQTEAAVVREKDVAQEKRKAEVAKEKKAEVAVEEKITKTIADVKKRGQQKKEAEAAPVVERPVNPAMAEAMRKAFADEANRAATSPKNDLPEPTEAQKKAGNYQKGHIVYQGMEGSIENPAGSVRRGVSPDGTPWKTKIKNHYGYLRRTEGADGDQVDFFMGDNMDADTAYVIDQIVQETGNFDEHKVMLGFNNRLQAVNAYKENYEKGWKVGEVAEMPMDEFKQWVRTGDAKLPISPRTPTASEAENMQALMEETDSKYGPTVNADGLLFRAVDETQDRTPVTTDSVNEAYQPLLEEMALQDQVTVHDSLAKAPLNLQKIIRDTNVGLDVTPTAVFHNGAIHVFADAHDSVKEAVQSLLHEGVAHLGMRSTMSDVVMDDMLIDVYESVENKPAFRKLVDTYGADLSDIDVQLEMAEEYIALIAENGTDQNVLQRVIAAVRVWMRENGITDVWTDNDITAMLRNVRKNMKEGKVAEMVESPALLAKMKAADKFTDSEKEVVTRLSIKRKDAAVIKEDPTTDQARTAKIDAIIRDGKKLPEASQIKKDLASGAKGARKRALQVIPRRGLKDFATSGAYKQSVVEMERLNNRLDGKQSERENKVVPIVDKWHKHHSANKQDGRNLADVMHVSTLMGHDPSIDFKEQVDVAATTKQIGEIQAQMHLGNGTLARRRKLTQLKKSIDAESKRKQQYLLVSKAYNNLSDTAKEIYSEVRDLNNETYDTTLKMLYKRIEDSGIEKDAKAKTKEMLRIAFESGRVEGPYFTLGRHGDWWGVAKRGDEVLSFSKFETPALRDQWVAEWNKEEGITATGGEDSTSQGYDDLRKVDPGFITQVENLLGKEGVNTGIKDQIWQMYLKTLPEMTARKSFIHRKGRMGFSEDALRTFTSHQFRNSHMLAKLEFAHKIEAKMRDVADAAKEASATDKWAIPLMDELIDRHDYAMNPRDKDWAVRLTNFGFHWYLGVNPSTAMVNLTQTWILGVPVLGAAQGGAMGQAKASKELAKASWQAPFAEQRGKLTPDEQLAFEEFARINLFEKTRAADLIGITEKGEGYLSNVPWRKLSEASAFMFHHAEKFNREVTALAAYRMARKRGESHADAILTAEDLTWDTHFDYSNKNRPPIMQQGVGRVFFLFKNYSANIGYRMGRDLVDSVKGEDRAASMQRLVGVLGMTALSAGAKGLPIWWAIYGIGLAMKDDDDPIHIEGAIRSYATETFGKEASHIIMDGPIDALTGITLSTRTSLSNLFYRNSEKHMEGPEFVAHVTQEIAGPIIGALLANMGMASYEWERGREGRALERISPTIVKGWLQSNRMETEGLQNRSGEQILNKEEFSEYDKWVRRSGFSLAKVGQAYKRLEVAYALEEKITARKAKLTSRWVQAQERGDEKALKDVEAQIAIYNSKHEGNFRDQLLPYRLWMALRNRRTGIRKSVGGVSQRAAERAEASGQQNF